MATPKKTERVKRAELTYREADFTVETREDGDTKSQQLRVSVSSETPYLREIWDPDTRKWVDAYEVLGHKEGEVDTRRMRDGLVIQDTHWGDQVGIMRTPEIKDGKLGGVVEFGSGERSQEIMRDALAGIRRNMSVGYRVLKFKREGTAEDGYPIFRAVKWQPYEASFVNVPADTEVGVGRSEDVGKEPGETEAEAPTATTQRNETMGEPKVETPVAAGVTAEEVRSIVKESVDALRADLTKKPEMPEAKRVAQFDESEKREIGKKYNILAAIRSLASKNPDEAGFEREVSDEIAKRTGRTATGMFIPDCIFMRSAMDKTAAAGLVATDTLFGEMIDALVAETVLGRAGAATLSGLVGDIAIPKGSAATAYWVTAEGGDATETTPTVAQVTGSPHTIGAYTDITRKLLLQSGISAQGFVIDALRGALARGIDAAGFSGSGSSGQPTGIENVVGVQTVSMVAGSPTKANMVEFWQKLITANVAGRKAFVASPAVKGLLSKTLDYTAIEKGDSGIAAVTAGRYLCEDDKVEGYDIFMSNLCNAKKLYFGDWSNLVLAFWSGIDLTVDPYSLSKSGGLRVVALQDMDIIVRHPEAFAIGTALS